MPPQDEDPMTKPMTSSAKVRAIFTINEMGKKLGKEGRAKRAQAALERHQKDWPDCDWRLSYWEEEDTWLLEKWIDGRRDSTQRCS